MVLVQLGRSPGRRWVQLDQNGVRATSFQGKRSRQRHSPMASNWLEVELADRSVGSLLTEEPQAGAARLHPY